MYASKRAINLIPTANFKTWNFVVVNHRIIEYPELEVTHKYRECAAAGPAQHHPQESDCVPESVV